MARSCRPPPKRRSFAGSRRGPIDIPNDYHPYPRVISVSPTDLHKHVCWASVFVAVDLRAVRAVVSVSWRISADVNGMLEAIDKGGPGSVYVMQLEDGADIAGMGGLMGTAMCSRGFAGAVIDGAVRDVTQRTRIGFPVYADGIVPSTVVGHSRFAGMNIPIVCDRVRLSPQDIVVSDADGVAVVPRERTREVLALAQKLDNTEALDGTPAGRPPAGTARQLSTGCRLSTSCRSGLPAQADDPDFPSASCGNRLRFPDSSARRSVRLCISSH